MGRAAQGRRPRLRPARRRGPKAGQLLQGGHRRGGHGGPAGRHAARSEALACFPPVPPGRAPEAGQRATRALVHRDNSGFI